MLAGVPDFLFLGCLMQWNVLRSMSFREGGEGEYVSAGQLG